MEQDNNRATLMGTLDGPPVYSHTRRGENYFTFPLRIRRLSGAEDVINILARSSLLESVSPDVMEKIRITGSLRSFNNRSGVGNRLILSVFAQTMELCNGEDKNEIALTGSVCRPTTLRKTPLGREICDMMLAVSRRYGRSDYLPCIAWGSMAKYANCLEIGDTVVLFGRIQSRNYIKCEGEAVLQKTAYEVSVSEFQRKAEIFC